MEIKVQDNNDINYDIDSRSTTQKSRTSFADTLNSIMSDSKCTQLSVSNKDITKISTDIVNEKTGIAVIDNLPEKNNTAVKSAIKDLENILGLNPYNYFK